MQTTLDPDATPPAEALSTPCTTCGAAMLPDQDWCLSCGTAAPGRLGRRPGGRAIGAISAATLLLVLVAVLAGYTALTDDAGDEASKAAGPSATPVPGQVAQVPDAPPTTTTAPPPVTTPVPTTSTPTTPSTATTTPVIPVTPPPVTPPPVTPPAVTPPPVVPPPPPPATTTGSTTTETTPTTPADTTEPIELGADATDDYDPSKRSTRSTDPADAADGNRKTAWTIVTPEDAFPMQVGLLIDLEKARNVKTIDLGTSTPGGRVEVYGAVGSAIPPDILDTRWEQIAARSDIDTNAKRGNRKGDGVEKIRVPGRGSTGARVRYVLLWFTTAPDEGPTVKVTEVALEG